MSSFPPPHYPTRSPQCPDAPPSDPPPPYSPPYPAATGYPTPLYPTNQGPTQYTSPYPIPQTSQPVGHPAQSYPPQGQPYPTLPQYPPGSQYGGAAYPQQQVVYVPGAFDAGARFAPGAPISIPPPPPGVAPNAAQIAAMQGNATVVMGQKKPDLFVGKGDFTFW
ncbi:DAZ-associated protein 2-like isoform X2 [Ornithodoros turicata]|uniref:DAZ-associated protein 2-like isoform X2 n=1 Tax=Ornithodoros turicata TaxID=34597 RepID=UPI00313A4C8A